MLFIKAVGLFDKHLKTRGSSPNTIYIYNYYLQRFHWFLCSQYNRQVYLDEVEPDDLERYLFTELGEEKASSSARHNMITAFKSLYSFCHMKGYCRINIGRLIRNVSVETKERDYITEIEFMRLARNITSPTAFTVIYTLFYTGIRISECVNLTLNDVDFENGVIMVREGKGNKDRNIPIHDKLKRLLLKYIEESRFDIGTDFLFSGKSGKVSKQYINRVLREAVSRAGIEKKVSCHVLRHSFISNLVHKGAVLLRVQKLAGHKSIKTVSTYLHANFEKLQEAVDLL
jgi:integrase/recombinase XerD